jgi:hypothetical protein
LLTIPLSNRALTKLVGLALQQAGAVVAHNTLDGQGYDISIRWSQADTSLMRTPMAEVAVKYRPPGHALKLSDVPRTQLPDGYAVNLAVVTNALLSRAVKEYLEEEPER